MSRKTRLVCVSDTHNASPANGAFKLPKGDVLIHAGDLTNQGTYAEIRNTLDWIDTADFKAKIVIAGNHDITLDRRFYTEHGLKFHNKDLQDSQACIDLFNEYPSIKYLNHESIEVCLSQDKEPQTHFKVFGSPYSPKNGLWAFGYTPENASRLWDQIPLDVDIVVTHAPPKYHCDGSKTHGAVGCEALQKRLWQVRPRLAVCGHVHEGRGAERVLWKFSAPNINNGEANVNYWIDPGYGNKKQSLLDLSTYGGSSLKNNQFLEVANASVEIDRQPIASHLTSLKEDSFKTPGSSRSLMLPQKYCDSKMTMTSSSSNSATAVEKEENSASRHDDNDAFLCRIDRKETCIVNAAIMASSWPHKTSGGKVYNKPIVVDIDLPIY